MWGMFRVAGMNKTRSVVESVFGKQKSVVGGGQPPDNGDTMEHRMTALETRFDTLLPSLATKTDISEVKVEIKGVANEIHKTASETHKWMMATVIGLFLGFGGLFLAMSNALKPSNQAIPQPVVINLPSSQK
jgi:hypothetical protein